MSALTLLALYLAAGCLTLLIAVTRRLLSCARDQAQSELLLESDAEISPPQSLIRRVLTGSAASAAIIALWPVGVCVVLDELYALLQPMRGRSEDGGRDTPFDAPLATFSPDTAHLIERLPRDVIERRETVPDPLGCVPPLPFGHLHARWQHFCAPLVAGDEIWSFESPHVTPFGTLEVRRGYARMRAGRVLAGMTVERFRDE